MKNQSISVFVFLSVVFSLFELSAIHAQQHGVNNFLKKIFNPQETNTKVLSDKTADNVQMQIKSELVQQNINKHLNNVTKLKAKGLSNKGIHIIGNLSKITTGTGSISGVVYESGGATPIQNFCDITAFNEYGKYMGSDYTSDYKNGEYVIDELPTGNYYVRTSSDKYANKYYDDVYDWQSATFVEVVDGQETSGINFSLEKYQGSISGKVTDVEGIPLNFCFVVAFDNNGEYSQSRETDFNGNYVIDGLQTGNYKIQAQYYMEDKNYAAEWYNNVYSSKYAELVTVIEPNTTSNIDFRLDKGGTIKGKVLEPSGASVYSYEAEIIAYDSEEEYIRSAGTDDMGEFLISGLTPGDYKLQIHYNGMKNYVEGNCEIESWYDGEVDYDKATPISVSISDTVKNLIINLHEGGKIKGSVYNYNGQPISYDCEISAYLENKTQLSYGVQVENGKYVIDKLPTGRYKLFANYSGYTQIVGQEPVSEWYDGASNFDNAQFVEVNAPNSTENINFTLERGGYISGRVYNDAGQPLSYSGSVEAYNLNYEPVGFREILNDGMYFITGLPSGEYKVKANYYGEDNYDDEWYNDALNFETATKITVNAPNHTANINFTLGSSEKALCSVQGFITDKNGSHLTDDEHLIQVYCFDAGSGEFVDFEVNSMNGGYQLDLVGNEFKIATVSYYANWMQRENNDSLAVTYYENGTSFNDPNTNIVSIVNNTAITLNNIVMNKVSGSISGGIYYKNSEEPTSDGFMVFVFDEYGYLATISSYNNDFSNPEGKFSACGLRPGNYYVLALCGDLWYNPTALWYGGYEDNIKTSNLLPKISIPSEAQTIVVADGETKDIDLYLPISTNFDKAENLPMEYVLSQNYPNPFNPITKIKYSIPKQSNVTLKVFDVLGSEVITLVNKAQTQGNYELEFDGSELTSGIYFYRMRVGDFVETKKMILLK